MAGRRRAGAGVGLVAAIVLGWGTGPACGLTLHLPDLKGGGCVSARPSPLQGAGGRLEDASGNEVRLTGVNWSGFETGTFVADGLWARNWRDLLDLIASAGFNALRLPFSNQLFDPGSAPGGIDYRLNPDLRGLRGLALMDRFVAAAGCRGLRVVLDRHKPDAGPVSDLWYTAAVPEQRWISDWVMLARHYAGDPWVVGADLDNEPHGGVSWGDGNPRTDWRLAAERAGDSIEAANPDWLIVVEGIDVYHGDSYRWGGNLLGAGPYPVRLTHPEKLVYSAHDYGLATGDAPWLHARDFPANLAGVWGRHWGYLKLGGTAPVLVGEFGGRSVGQDLDGTWQRTLVGYLKEGGFSYTYWTWNANSEGTGGLLEGDWRTVNPAKYGLLATYQWPRPR